MILDMQRVENHPSIVGVIGVNTDFPRTFSALVRAWLFQLCHHLHFAVPLLTASLLHQLLMENLQPLSSLLRHFPAVGVGSAEEPSREVLLEGFLNRLLVAPVSLQQLSPRGSYIRHGDRPLETSLSILRSQTSSRSLIGAYP